MSGKMPVVNKARLMQLYSSLRKRFGYLGWWPGETRDEIIIGAILTQNTSWKNVEKAIAGLKENGLLELSKLSSAAIGRIEQSIRPSGFYRQKARRLKGLAAYITSNYKNLDGFFSSETGELRKKLLSLDGIGNETADSIILYAAGKPVFVIDAYTKRIMERVYGIDKEMGYEELQKLFMSALGHDTRLFNDFHAQMVELGKNYCRKKPLCAECPARELCNFARHLQIH